MNQPAPAPAIPDLGSVGHLAPTDLAPGAMILDRFCIVGAPRATLRGWVAPATDISRALGTGPHGRLDLHFLAAPDPQRTRAMIAAHRLAPRVLAVASSPDGLLVVTRPVPAESYAGPPTDAARALVDQLVAFHDAGLVGVRFSEGALRGLPDSLAVADFDHLLAAPAGHDDLYALRAVLDALGVDLPPVGTARAARELLCADHAPNSARDLLPPLPPFVGRQRELQALLDAAVRARAGHASLVTVIGPAGVGKSRLVEQLLDEMARCRFEAIGLHGGFHREPGAAGRRLSNLLDDLAVKLAALPARDRAEARARISAATGPLVGVVAEPSPAFAAFLDHPAPAPTVLFEERLSRHTAVLARALGAVGTRARPLVVTLDDGELGDQVTVEVLRELVGGGSTRRGVPESATLIVVCARDEVPRALWDLRPTVVDLRPLDRDDVERLLVHTVPGRWSRTSAAADAVLEASGGVPLAAWTTLQAWVESGRLRRSAEDEWYLADVSDGDVEPIDLYAWRFRGASPLEREVAVLAALRPGAVAADWLAATVHRSVDETATTLDALVTRGLLLREPSGALRWPHGSVRERVIASAGPADIAAAHRRIADWLDAIGASATQRAWHREHALPPGPDRAVAAAHLAGGHELARVYDLERAAWHFERALERGEETVLRRDAWEGLADAHLQLGRADEALTAYNRSIDETLDAEHAVTVAAKAIYVFYRKSAPEAALALASRALRLAGEPLPTGPLSFLAALVWVLVAWIASRPTGGSVASRNALQHLYAHLVASVAATHAHVVTISIARACLHARGLQTEEAVVTRCFAAAALATLPFVSPDRPRAILADAERIARAIPSARGVAVVEHIRGQNELSVGRYTAGQRAMGAAVDEFRRTGDMSVAVLTLGMRALYGRNRENIVTLRGWLEEGDLAASRQGNLLARAMIRAVRQVLEVRSGETGPLSAGGALSAEGTAALNDAVEAVTSLEADNLDVIVATAVLAQALCEAGRGEDAWAQVLRAQERLRASGLPGFLEMFNEVHLARAMVLTGFPGVCPKSDKEAERALATLEKVGARSTRMAAAHALLAARLDARLGRVARARERLAGLIAAADQHGERFLVFQAHRLLADLDAPTDLGASREHQRRAGRIAVELGLQGPDAPDAASSEPPPPPPPLRSEPGVVDVAEVVDGLVGALTNVMPSHIRLCVEDVVRRPVASGKEELQLLVVNLVLAGRDALPEGGLLTLAARAVALDGAASARLPGGQSGEHVVIEVRTEGHSASALLGGLSVTRQITSRLGGFLDVRKDDAGELVFSAYLPPPGGAAAPRIAQSVRAVVVHDDRRVASTLTGALGRLGVDATEVDPASRIFPRDSSLVVFAAAAIAGELRGPLGDDMIVALVRRGDTPPEGLRSLRVPFAVGELDELLAELSRGSSDTASLPG